MSLPKTLVIYHSHHHQNTLRVAEAIARVLDAELRQPAEVPLASIRDYELIGFGSGIYFGRFDKSLRDWIRGLPDADLTTVKKAFLFSTSGLPCLWRLWHWPLKALLSRKGFAVVGEFHCGGFDTVGPLKIVGGLNRQHPDACDLEDAAAFAQRIVLST